MPATMGRIVPGILNKSIVLGDPKEFPTANYSMSIPNELVIDGTPQPILAQL